MIDIIVETYTNTPNWTEEATMRLVLPAPISPREHASPTRGRWYCDSTKNRRSVLGHGTSGSYYVRGDVDYGYHQSIELVKEWQILSFVPHFPLGFFFDSEGPGGDKLPFLILEDFNVFLPREDDWYGRGTFKFTYNHFNNDYSARWKPA